uniref:NADH-ubiquinone oxidoreductase chain 3 n=1 Tax=Allothyrus sp. LamingtonNP-QMS95173 TaxID=1442165 RepID=W0FDA5_9ACAR|nr:NADH dehydrogenase subunit 3 [Allothyrus sp. LamingtonNP-QMS95173]
MILLMISLILSFMIMMISIFLSKKTYYDKEKLSPFECGFDPFSMTRIPFSLHFFMIAIIFLIFDIEIIILLPIPIINNFMNNNFFIMTLFIILVILLGLIFEWSQGALNWIN